MPLTESHMLDGTSSAEYPCRCEALADAPRIIVASGVRFSDHPERPTGLIST